jgi:hypothetical protein
MTDYTIGGMFKEKERIAPKERFALMDALNQASSYHKLQGFHPILEPHCICGFKDCPSPIFCNCSVSTQERKEKE